MKLMVFALAFVLLCGLSSVFAASEMERQRAELGKFNQESLAQLQAADYQVAAIRQRVLRKCGLAANVSPDKLPWYFHYEFALELLEAGHAREALDVLYRSTAKRTIPKRRARMYGMWFVDYLPYYKIAATHAQLGNWTCARRAMEKAEHFGVLSGGDADFEAYRQLRSRIYSRTGVSGSVLSLLEPSSSDAGCA